MGLIQTQLDENIFRLEPFFDLDWKHDDVALRKLTKIYHGFKMSVMLSKKIPYFIHTFRLFRV